MIDQIPGFLVLTAFFLLVFLLFAGLAEGYGEPIELFLKKIRWNTGTAITIFFVWIVVLLLRKLTYYIPFTGVVQTKDALLKIDKNYPVIIFFSLTWIVLTLVLFVKNKPPGGEKFYIWWVLAFVLMLVFTADKIKGVKEFPQVLFLVVFQAPLLFFKFSSSGKYLGLLTALAASCYMVNRYNKIKTKKKKFKLKITSVIIPLLIFAGILTAGAYRFTGDFESKVIHRIRAAKSAAVLEDLIDAVNSMENGIDKSLALKETAASIAKTGDIQWALVTAQTIETENKRDRFYALKEVAAAALKTKDIKSAEEILTQSMEVAATLGNTGKLEASREILYTLPESGELRWPREIFQQLFHIVETLPGGNQKADLLEEIIAAGSKASNKHTAEEIIKRSFNMVNSIESGSRRFLLLRQIAAATSNRGRQKELYPLIITVAGALENKEDRYVLLVDMAVSTAKTGDLRWSQEIFQQALDVARTILDEKERLVGAARIASVIAETGNKEWAGELLRHPLAAVEQMDNKSGKAEVLIEIAAAFAKTGDTKKSGKLFQQALDIAEKIGGNWLKSRTFTDIAAVNAETGDIPQAKKMLKQAADTAISIHKNNTYKPETLMRIASAVLTLGETKWAKEILKQALHAVEMKEFNENEARFRYKGGILPEIAALAADTGDIEWTMEIFQQAAAAAGKIKSSFLKHDTLKQIGLRVLNLKTTTGKLNLKKKILRQIMEAAEGIKNGKEKYALLTAIALGVAKTGDMKWTEETFDRLLHRAEMTKGIFEKETAFIAVAEAAAKTGNTKWRKKIFKRIVSAGETLSYWGQTSFLRDVSVAVAKSGDIKSALSIAGTIEAESIRMDALAKIHQIKNE